MYTNNQSSEYKTMLKAFFTTIRTKKHPVRRQYIRIKQQEDNLSNFVETAQVPNTP